MEEKESKLIYSSIHFIKLKYETATLPRRTAKIYPLLELFVSFFNCHLIEITKNLLLQKLIGGQLNFFI
jgi:hypothetical protein